MKTFEADPRFDDAFEQWFASVSSRGLKWMEDEYTGSVPSWQGGAARDDEREASALLARWFVRENIREAWELRERAVAEEAELIEGALRGTLDIAVRHVVTARQLAESVKTGNVNALPRHMRELLEPMVPWYPWDNPEGALGIPDGIGEPFALSRLVYLAGRALRDSGQLEDAFAAYIWSRSAWGYGHATGNSDEGLRIEPYGWRWGVPRYGEWQVWCGDDSPYLHRVDWSKYDHIVGCGTTIRQKTLDLLGIPRAKQHITEVHNWVPRMWDGHFPRLTGRVAVVDDVVEGQTGATLAKLYDGDVVSVLSSGCVGRERPVCVVIDPLVQADLDRPGRWLSRWRRRSRLDGVTTHLPHPSERTRKSKVPSAR